MIQLDRNMHLKIIAILVIVVMLTITWISQTELAEHTALSQSLAEENKSLKLTSNQLSQQIAALEKEAQLNAGLVPADILERLLKEQGITKDQLKADLQKRTDLIKHKPVLGGTMYFPESEIRILSDRWVMAGFEDGHILGYILLSYEVKSGKINWTVMNSYVLE